MTSPKRARQRRRKIFKEVLHHDATEDSLQKFYQLPISVVDWTYLRDKDGPRTDKLAALWRKHNRELRESPGEALYPDDYTRCYELFVNLEKHRKEYGLQEHNQILRDLLEMTLTNGVWGSERAVYLGPGKEKAREMGSRLNEIGGFQLMLSILQDTYKGDRCELEWAWDGIGEWEV